MEIEEKDYGKMEEELNGLNLMKYDYILFNNI
jgi:hypothetical protein